MLNRLYQLLLKFLSVKGIFVLITTIAYFMNKIDYWYVLVSWSIFIGSREIYKLVTKPKTEEEKILNNN